MRRQKRNETKTSHAFAGSNSEWVKVDDSDPLVGGASMAAAPLRFIVKFFFAFSDVGFVGFSAIMGFYLNAFLLEVAGVSPQAVGIILLGAKLADAISDPLIGFLSDRTRTRWGRRKIWVAIAFLPAVLLYVAIWIVPDLSASAKIAYYAVVLIVFSAGVSAVTLPVSALAPELTTNYDERTSLMMWKVLALSLITIVATFVQSLLVEAFHYPPNISQNISCGLLNVSALVNGTLTSSVDVELGYFVSGIGFAVFAVPFVILFLIFVPERKVGRKKRAFRRDGSVRHKQFTAWESLKTMLTNRGFVCVTLIYLTSQLAIQFVQNNLILYIKYVLLRDEWFSYILLVLLGTACCSLPVWERLSRRFGKKRMYFVGASIGICAFLMAFFINFFESQSARDVLIWVTAFVGGFSIGALFLIPTAMLPDAITQDELVTGTRREGVFYAFFILFQKVSLAVAVAISNFVLSASGYVAPGPSGCMTPIQPPNTVLALSLMIGVAPAAIMALSLIFLAFYPITKEMHLQTLEVIDSRNQQDAMITTDGEVTVVHDDVNDI